MLKMLNMLKIKILARENKTYLNLFYFRDRPFNLQGGVTGFLFRSKQFFRTTRVRILIFFVTQSANFFPQNSTLGYMTKTLNQIIFFPPPKSEYFFQQHWESEYFFRKETFKLNGRTLMNFWQINMKS